MGSLFDRLQQEQLITDAPAHMKNNVHYECIMGSIAYGVSNDNSDVDVYGFCMPPRHMIFPYESGNIVGFGNKPENFNQYQKHHIHDIHRNKEYDITIYGLVRYFQLCMENNPNMIDSLFVPTRCIIHATQIGQHVRNNRKIFLSKRIWHTFKGYAHKQLHKMKSKFAKEWVELCKKNQWDIQITREELDIHWDHADISRALFLLNKIEHKGKRTKRLPMIEEYGYDVKFAYHVVRLLDECAQMLEGMDLDLTRNREQLKSIRRGEWSIESIEDYFDRNMILLEGAYAESKLPYAPDEDKIKKVLMECIEMHYGSIEKSGMKDSTNFNLNEFNKYINDMNVASMGLNRTLTGYKR